METASTSVSTSVVPGIRKEEADSIPEVTKQPDARKCNDDPQEDHPHAVFLLLRLLLFLLLLFILWRFVMLRRHGCRRRRRWWHRRRSDGCGGIGRVRGSIGQGDGQEGVLMLAARWPDGFQTAGSRRWASSN